MSSIYSLLVGPSHPDPEFGLLNAIKAKEITVSRLESKTTTRKLDLTTLEKLLTHHLVNPLALLLIFAKVFFWLILLLEIFFVIEDLACKDKWSSVLSSRSHDLSLWSEASSSSLPVSSRKNLESNLEKISFSERRPPFLEFRKKTTLHLNRPQMKDQLSFYLKTNQRQNIREKRPIFISSEFSNQWLKSALFIFQFFK